MKPPLEREELADALVACAYVERTTAHVLLGWMPLVVDIDHKLVIARHQYAAITRAARLERHVQTMTRIRGGHPLAVARGWRVRMQAIDGSRTPEQMLRRLYLEVRAALAAHYRELAHRCDPLLDAALVEVLTPAIEETTEQLGWARRVLRARPPARASRRWFARARGTLLTRKQWLWSPLSRVPHAARPPELEGQQEAGEVALPLVPPGKRAAGAMLHENIDAEITTMELFARCSYEHPDMPEAFHRDMSRQTSDESRHARACLDLASAYGMPHGTFATSTDVYDFHYELKPCKPGSRRELLWRLLLRSTFQEALSLDGFQTLSARLVHDKAFDAARLLESLTADEVFHVESGLRWPRFLCKGNDDRVFRERETAHRYYVMSARRTRRQFVANHPDRAIAETEQLWKLRQAAQRHYPFDLSVYLAHAVRTAVGFSARDLEQVLAWGYVHDESGKPSRSRRTGTRS